MTAWALAGLSLTAIGVGALLQSSPTIQARPDPQPQLPSGPPAIEAPFPEAVRPSFPASAPTSVPAPRAYTMHFSGSPNGVPFFLVMAQDDQPGVTVTATVGGIPCQPAERVTRGRTSMYNASYHFWFPTALKSGDEVVVTITGKAGKVSKVTGTVRWIMSKTGYPGGKNATWNKVPWIFDQKGAVQFVPPPHGPWYYAN